MRSVEIRRKYTAGYRELRNRPVWSLLASRHGPVIIGLLQSHLLSGEQRLPASVFQERIARDLEDLRANGEDLPQTAQAYIADWLRDGYLERRFPQGAAEEEYEVSAAAATAIRFISSLTESRVATTESRLASVIQQLVKLAEETDTNPETRVASLLAERDRLDREIETVRSGRITAITDAQALERIRDISSLADDLTGDFRRVRDEFERLNRDLRERLLDENASRGEVLDRLFAGVDLIGESDAGRTFAAFWRLLTDPNQSAVFHDAIGQVLSRNFAAHLNITERRFLITLTRTLLVQGGIVHEALRHFAATLKNFVQSREYLEHRRITQLLKEGQRAALAIKDAIRIGDGLAYTLPLTSSKLMSFSQWSLHDPSLNLPAGTMHDAGLSVISLEAVAELVSQSEINFRELKANIRAVLEEAPRASIGEVLIRFPAQQGLGSVVGHLALGSRHGVLAGTHETVGWRGGDQRYRQARIPKIYFLREQSNELA